MLKLFRFLKPYTFSIVTVLFLLFMGAMADLILPTLMANIVNTGIVNNDLPYIYRTGAFMLLIAFGGISCAVTSSFISSGVTLGFSKTVRSGIFARVESYSLHEFDKVGTASLITRTTNDVSQVQATIAMMMSIMVRAPIMCVGGIIMAVSRDRQLSLILLAAIPLLAALIILIAGRGVPLFSVMQKKLDRLNMVIREKLSGIRVVRAFDRMDREKERFDGASHGIMDTALELAGLMNLMMPAVMLVMNFTIIAIVWFGGQRAAAGKMRVGDIMAFVQYSSQILFALMMVSMLFIMIPRSQASAVRINEVLELEPEITDPEQAKRGGNKKGSVEFRNVSFTYHGAEQPAISGISFSAGPGEVTAIIGGTGSGKTTMVSLIPRFYDTGGGSVLINGVDVREMAIEDLRGRIGFVPQKAVLFSGTVGDNVRFGDMDADDAGIKRAVEISQAAEFIKSMERGYDSEISQGGVNLSGGQKQRLSIARAIARKPEIFVFDDSFSALDFKTDADLRAALKKETADASVFIVAQRVATIMGADRIIVLEDGKACGMGTHRELMQSCEIYREIVHSQISAEELA